MCSNVLDRTHPAMKIASSVMLLIWAPIVLLLPLCFLGQWTLMGNLSFLLFSLFDLWFKFPSAFCFSALAEFFFAAFGFDIIVVEADFNLQQ